MSKHRFMMNPQVLMKMRYEEGDKMSEAASQVTLAFD